MSSDTKQVPKTKESSEVSKDVPAKQQKSGASLSILPGKPSVALIIPLIVDPQSVPRSAAGIVSETGDVVDKSGKKVGKISNPENLSDLVGSTVNEGGDVVDKAGDILGKSVPLGDNDDEPDVHQDDNEHDDDDHDEQSEYTHTTEQPEKSSLEGVKDAAEETGKTVTKNLPIHNSQKKKDESKDDSAEQEEEQPINLEDRDATQEVDGVQSPKSTSEQEKPDYSDVNGKETSVDEPEVTESPAPISKEPTEAAKSEATPSEAPDIESSKKEAEDKIPDVEATDVEATDVEAPDVEAPDVEAPDVEAPDVEAPDVEATKDEAEGEVKEDLPEGEDLKDKAPEAEVPEDEELKEKVPEGEDLEEKAPEAEVPEAEVPKDKPEVSEGEDLEEKAPEAEVPEDEEVKDKVPEGEDLEEKAPEAEVPEGEELKEQAPEAEVPEEAKDVEEKAEDISEGLAALKGCKINKAGNVIDEDGDVIGNIVDGDQKALVGKRVNARGEVEDDDGNVIGKVEPLAEEPTDEVKEAEEEAEKQIPKGLAALKGCRVNKAGNLVDDDGDIVGNIVEGDKKDLVGKRANGRGEIEDDDGNVIGKVEPLAEEVPVDLSFLKGLKVDKDGKLRADDGEVVGRVAEGDLKKLVGKKADENGNILSATGKTIGRAEAIPEGEEEEEAPLDYSALKGCKVNKAGNLVNSQGELVGHVIEGDVKKLQGKRSDENGEIWNDSGKVIGKAEPLPDSEREDLKQFAPFENFPGATVEEDGKVMHEGKQVGVVTEGDPKRLNGCKVDEDGDILDRSGNVIGKAGPVPEEEEVVEEKVDMSALKGCRVNKAGNLANSHGEVVGRVVEGELKHLIGKRSDENGDIWDDSGKKCGRAELVPDSEREDLKAYAPFENFPGATVEEDGKVMFESKQVGIVVEGDHKRLKGAKVDEDGDILDRRGNVIGKAEPWDEPEPEPEAAVDMSSLAGKRVNKAGNVVDKSGEIYGRIVEGNVKNLVGRMCDKEGNVRSESGDIIGKAELVGEGEREGTKEGPFAELQGCTVAKDGKVVTPSGDVVGRLTSGDPKVLFGRAVDDDGEILDKNGNSIGKAERWEEPEVEKKKDFLAGRKVNREGNVLDDEGNVVGKLTSGELLVCSGKEVDDDGDVVNQKGQTIGHVTRLEDIPPEPEVEEPEPEPEGETDEEKQKRELAENDAKLAGQLSYAIEQSLDKIRPICALITDKIDSAERKPKDELDEEELVKQVRPLIEEGGKILTETNGIIRGFDPDGRIQRQAKSRAGTKEASPEEHHLAECLKELTGTVSTTIDNAKRKIADMPHAKKELNPLWALLAEPLGQIIAAVGLLLTGVLGLVGKLLSGLGLGGLVDGLLGGLGLSRILKGLGLGDVVGSLTGKKK
ncbi:Fc.00g009470.m01.CDS01 [Cosmosporella sp. VM-42]